MGGRMEACVGAADEMQDHARGLLACARPLFLWTRKVIFCFPNLQTNKRSHRLSEEVLPWWRRGLTRPLLDYYDSVLALIHTTYYSRSTVHAHVHAKLSRACIRLSDWVSLSRQE